jgi:hypothetical protein
VYRALHTNLLPPKDPPRFFFIFMRKLKVRKAKGIPKYTQPGSGWVKPDT